MIELKNIFAGYNKKNVIINFSAVFGKNNITAIIGVNGSGKSTLLKSIAGIIPLSSGNIIIDGSNLSVLKPNESARLVSYLSQNNNIPDMTVEQAVLHGRFAYLKYPRIYTDNDRKIAAEAINCMGLSEYSQVMLHKLSGGMRQKVYIAMVLTQCSNYVLLDEPTTYLDVSHKYQLMKTMRSLADSGKGIIAVLHDLPLAMEYADNIMIIDNGGLVLMDSVENVFSTGIIGNIFGVELKRTKIDNGLVYYFK